MDDFRENVIEFVWNGSVATVTTCQGRYISDIKKYAKEMPDECQIVAENPNGTIVAHLPSEWVRIRPKKKVSDEQREMAAERFRQMRAAKMSGN